MTKFFNAFLFLAAFIPASAHAQTPAADPALERAPEPAFVRAWLFPGNGKEPLQISLVRSAQDPPKVLTSSENGSRSTGAGYGDVPAGNATLEVRSGEKVLSSKSVALKQRGYYTFLAWSRAGRWETELFSDGTASSPAADRPLRILNFAAGRTTVLSHGKNQETKVAGDGVQEIRLPATVNGFSVAVFATNNAPPALTSSEIDFTDIASAYVVVAPDYRGRMRPETISGGAPKIEAVAASAPLPKLDPAEQAKLERERVASNRRLERDHTAAQIAILEAQIKEGVNVPENAEGVRSELRKKLNELQSTNTSPTPSVPAR